MKSNKKVRKKRRPIFLFAWSYQIGPRGGALDGQGSFGTVEAAKKAFEKGGFHFGNIATFNCGKLCLTERYYNGSVGWLKAIAESADTTG